MTTTATTTRRGRPPVADKEPTTMVAVQVPDRLLAELDAYARAHDHVTKSRTAIALGKPKRGPAILAMLEKSLAARRAGLAAHARK